MRLKILSIATMAVVAVSAIPAYATADGPDFWQVWNVAPDDTLNYRVGPGSKYPKLGSVPHNADQIKVVVCVPTTTRNQWFQLSEAMQAKLVDMTAWCLIERYSEQLGWVNRRYLTEDDE